MSRAAKFGGTTVVRKAHRFDENRLGEWLSQNVAEYGGPISSKVGIPIQPTI